MSYWHDNLWTQPDQATENKAVPYTSQLYDTSFSHSTMSYILAICQPSAGYDSREDWSQSNLFQILWQHSANCGCNETQTSGWNSSHACFRRWLTITYLPLLFRDNVSLKPSADHFPISHAGRRVWMVATRMCRMLTISYEPSSLHVVLRIYSNAVLLDLQKRDHLLAWLLDSCTVIPPEHLLPVGSHHFALNNSKLTPSVCHSGIDHLTSQVCHLSYPPSHTSESMSKSVKQNLNNWVWGLPQICCHYSSHQTLLSFVWWSELALDGSSQSWSQTPTTLLPLSFSVSLLITSARLMNSTL